MIRQIYADNAATTQLSQKAYEAMTQYLLIEYGNASQPYSFARMPKKALKQSREIIANCIGALPEEIYFTSCGTESDNWVVNGAVDLNKKIIISSIEHHAILNPCRYFQCIGHNVSFLPVSSVGLISPDTLKCYKNSDNGLVSVMFANNEIGTIQPISELSSIAHNKGWLFHTDAVQAVGHTAINVHQLGIDLLSASAHKFNGPKGVGFLYIKKGVDWPSLIKGGSQESNMRAGTENIAAIVGMAVALEENVNQLLLNNQHISALETRLIDTLNAAKIEYQRNGVNHIPGIISLSFKGFSGELLLHRLDLMGICVSTGSACDSTTTQISHVLQAIGLNSDYAKGTIRISLGKNNTFEEVAHIADSIIKIVRI
ncbi:cysteine desulfurase family protein [Bacteroides faecium]|uniref:cysteine desulfurase n=1 Tax=Bacteroides faecium TaxID=2715212 RepID=A0A6H0KP42_9BACE|nr:cysteine desulfurase family protein [Bacteroides faecium]QIU94943.1 cysteine desulfurase [Bacteroides faecium]